MDDRSWMYRRLMDGRLRPEYITGVARVRRRGENICPILNLKCKPIYWANIGRQENIVFCWWKMEWESPPSILVTRNPNWSQRLSTGTGCVKGTY